MSRKTMALYDESCSLCQQTKRTMEKLDWFHRVEWISLQEHEKAGSGPGFRAAALRRELHIIDQNGKVLKGFYAVRRLFLLFPLTFAAGLLMYLPLAPAVGNPFYKWIAANRYRFMRRKCENGSCSLE
ncbi:DUF393 domain-containing protein [Bacillus sp. REN3]|uniref:thiol-disulfide oxidoreductase DCC family protein n=1 Tax=Bacillus sp. REN3 TaxID=2802440 RepID=UPI001FEE2061|nr:DUF393 domain-containing protein [Bacillus sp. REN3]